MKILRIILAAVLLVAALLALSAQRQGSGALAAQMAYLIALCLLIIDRVVMVRQERLANGRAVVQIGVVLLIASLIFSPDFAVALQKKRRGMPLVDVVKMAQSNNENQRILALEVCLARRAFKACNPAFQKAAQSTHQLTKSLGQAGLRGQSGLKR